ncbi:RING-type E3 ubiquitin transferase [Ranunculus cassubicifolius]
MEITRYCNGNEHPGGVCSSCGISHRDTSTSSSRASSSTSTGVLFQSRGSFMYKLILALISGALTALFALAGAFTGAITGALAGRASDSGILRGAGLGAVAGAVLSVEVLEASRAYWCSERSTSPSSPSMADFIEELLHGRLVREQLVPTMFTDYRWQVHIANSSYDRMYAAFDQVASKGLSPDSLKKLPFHLITSENKAALDGGLCCTICLQDIEVGETVRRLQRCHHMFHLTCVDKWLVRQDSCPVCRQVVY